MRTTIIPAQITSVEDRIAGNLGFSQILLLIAAFLTAICIYVFILPRTSWSYEKIISIVCISGSISLLSVRIRGRIILDWIRIMSIYSIRPRYFIANKNTLTHRKGYSIKTHIPKVSPAPIALSSKNSIPKPVINFRTLDIDKLLLTNRSVRIKPTKGGLHVELG